MCPRGAQFSCSIENSIDFSIEFSSSVVGHPVKNSIEKSTDFNWAIELRPSTSKTQLKFQLVHCIDPLLISSTSKTVKNKKASNRSCAHSVSLILSIRKVGSEAGVPSINLSIARSRGDFASSYQFRNLTRVRSFVRCSFKDSSLTPKRHFPRLRTQFCSFL